MVVIIEDEFTIEQPEEAEDVIISLAGCVEDTLANTVGLTSQTTLKTEEVKLNMVVTIHKIIDKEVMDIKVEDKTMEVVDIDATTKATTATKLPTHSTSNCKKCRTTVWVKMI